MYVYFNNENSLINADIKFFEERIKLYEGLLKVESKNFFPKDICVKDLFDSINKNNETIEKAIWKMIKIHSNYRYNIDNQFIITKEGVEWLYKNCFKNQYIQLLEKYKMELTEEYIKRGYIYDNFF